MRRTRFHHHCSSGYCALTANRLLPHLWLHRLTWDHSSRSEAWVYIEAAQPFAVIMGKPHTDRNADPFISYALGTSQDGTRLEFAQSTGQPGSYRSVTAPTITPLRTWTHVAATLSSGMMRLFINGQEVASAASAGTPNNSDVPFAIGAGAAPGGGIASGGFGGALRQARVWIGH